MVFVWLEFACGRPSRMRVEAAAPDLMPGDSASAAVVSLGAGVWNRWQDCKTSMLRYKTANSRCYYSL